MANGSSDRIPTRSALLEMRDERQVMQEGYRFLDEKRLLLAAEILRQLQAYRKLRQEVIAQHREAVEALRGTVRRHGLEGAASYPVRPLAGTDLQRERQSFLGVPLLRARLTLGDEAPLPAAENPSPEAAHCAQRFRALLPQSAQLAAAAGNLHRLIAEYKRTERRARALEDVLLPELNDALRELEAHLEDMEQEEAVRVRLDYGHG